MRALTYIATKGTESKEVATYNEMQELKAEGYTITEKMEEITPPKPSTEN